MREFAETLAREAAAIALEGFRTGARIEKKGAVDLLTKYDLAAEAHIRARIEERYPTHTIVGEEGGESGGSDDSDAEDPGIWYVDPIDGTTNFANGHPFFCTSIAFYEGAQPMAGAVVAPALDLRWSAARGEGATRNGEACAVSAIETLQDALLATGFPYDRHTNADNNAREFAHLLRRAQGIRRCGSAAIDLCLVADGTYDGYWEQRLSPWDMCAGALIVQEAGGTLSDYDGAPADPRSGRIVATGGPLHASLLSALAEVREPA